MLYVAEAGEGGDEEVVVDIVPGDFPEFETFLNGRTGRISKIDPGTGERTTVADGLPSNAHPEFGTVGPAAVAFIGDQLYYAQTHGGDEWGFPGEPTGIYKVNDDGTVELLADIGAFNVANPVSDITAEGMQADIEPGGNPYSMVVRDGAFFVSDGNQNQVMRVDQDGSISRVAELSGHPVSTGITFDPSGGPFYVAELGQEPFNPEDGLVVTVSLGGAINVVASGFSALTDVGIGPHGQLYALQFADQAPPPGPPLAPFSAKVLKVNSDGTMTPVVTGFTFATAMLFDGAKLYLLSNGLSVLGPGEVWVIDDITAVPSPAPPPPAAAEPAPAPAPVVIAPSTGSGGALDGGTSAPWLAVSLALLALGLPTAAAGTWAWRKAR
jgi:sugar lactone lactonase YvrE